MNEKVISMLKTGRRVKLRNGEAYLVLMDVDTNLYGHQDFAFVSDYGFMCGLNYDDDLICKDTNSSDEKRNSFDVMSIHNVNNNCNGINGSTLDLTKLGEPIWEREKEMTISDIEKILGYKIKIVNKKGLN